MSATITTPEARTSDTLGTDISHVETINDALIEADLDWGIKMISADNISITTDDGITNTAFSGHRFVLRDDNDTTLGVVGKRYTPINNRTAFSIGEHFLDQGATLKTAGALDGGRSTFMTYDFPGLDVAVGGQDIVKFGLAITAAHDGSGTVNAGLTATRLVCTNGMMASIKGLPHVFRIRHTASGEARLTEARSILQSSIRFAKGFSALAEHMVNTPMDRATFDAYLDNLLPEPDAEAKSAHTRWEKTRSEISDLYYFSQTNDFGRDTAWGAYNAVTEYLDWASPVRGAEQHGGAQALRTRRRFEGATGNAKRDEALDLLVDDNVVAAAATS